MRPVVWTVGEEKFCLDARNYSNLSLNTAELLRWMLEARGRLYDASEIVRGR